MPQNSLWPGFVNINYASQHGQHNMRIPTSLPFYDDGDAAWKFQTGVTSQAVATVVPAFVNLLRPIFRTDTVFTDYTVYTLETPESQPAPRFSGGLNLAGTNVATSFANKATQMTFTFRTHTFGIFKLVLLDAPVSSWEVIRDLSTWSDAEDIADYVMNPAGWVRGRDGGIPSTFLQVSRTLNERLRRAYRMV